MAFTQRDSTGQLWSFTPSTDGGWISTPVGTAPLDPSLDCTVTLQSVVDLCRTHVDLMPLANVGGFTQEPALSLANDTIQELLSAPYDWKFNASEVGPLVTQPARQDYLFAGASAFVPGISGVGVGLAADSAITQSGTTVTVVCLQSHGFTVGQTVYMTGNTVDGYNSTYTQTPTSSGWSGGWPITSTPNDKTFTFETAAGLGTSGASGVTDLGWLSSATMYDTAATDPNTKVWELQAVSRMKPNSQSGRPEKICVLSQSGGILKLRLSYVPGNTVFAITLNYQMKAPLKTDLTQTWAPFPDEFGFVYRQMFLARCYRYQKLPVAAAERQLAEALIARAIGRDDAEESDQYVTPERTLMGDVLW